MTAVAYVLKMYPRLSETFILNELLELERQGIEVHVFSLRTPESTLRHGDAARLRASVTYVPDRLWPPRRDALRAHLRLLARHPSRYIRTFRHELSRLRRGHRSGWEHLVQAGFIAGELRRRGIRHIHAHFASSATSVARRASQLDGATFSLTAHAKDIFHEDVRADDLARKLHDASFVVTVSDHNVGYLAGIEPGARIVRIYNGLDLARFHLRRPIGRPEWPVVLGVGRLVEKKGFADLLDACAELRRRGRAFRCVIAGTGELADDLRARAAALGLDGLVELPGAMVREELMALYESASVLVAPCVVGSDGNRDGLPTVLVEAMALGVPVVATDVTGIPELVEDGVTGRIVGQHDPGALADAIERTLDDDDETQRLVRRARARVEAHFDLAANVALLAARFRAQAATPAAARRHETAPRGIAS